MATIETDQQRLKTAILEGFQLVEIHGLWTLCNGPAWLLKQPAHQLRQEPARWNMVLQEIRERFPAFREKSTPDCSEEDWPLGLAATDFIALVARTLIQPAEMEMIPTRDGNASRDNSVTTIYRSLFHSILGDALICAHNMLSATIAGMGVEHSETSKKTHIARAQLSLLHREVNSCCKHILTRSVLAIAKDRGIPVTQIHGEQRLFMLGTGAKAHLLTSSSTDLDSQIGAAISQDKRSTNHILKKLGIPTTRQITVTSKEDISKIFPRIQGPAWVMKPPDLDRGEGVFTDIKTTETAIRCYEDIVSLGLKQAILEQQLEGSDHRLTVVNGRLAYCVKRDPPSVVGDGIHTVKELIDIENRKRESLSLESGVYGRIEIDEEVLGRIRNEGHDIDEVLPHGITLQLRGKANVSTGGLRTDVSELVHPAIAELSVRIAAFLNLNIAGIDYITADISKDPNLCKGAVIEVNSMPQLLEERANLLIEALPFESNPYATIDFLIVSRESFTKSRDGLRQFGALIHALRNRHHYRIIAVPHSLQIVISDTSQGSSPETPGIRTYQQFSEVLIDKTVENALFVLAAETIATGGLPNTTPGNVYCAVESGKLNQLGIRELLTRVNATMLADTGGARTNQGP